MRGPGPDSWLQRPMFVAIGGFIVGAAVAGIVLFIVLQGGGDNTSNPRVKATAAARPTGTQSPAPTGSVTPGGGATATPGTFGTALDALAAFVVQHFNPETYAGPCPSTGAPAQGVCSGLLYESDLLATYTLGHSASEGLGEAVITQDGGKWTLEFLQAPPTRTISAGADAIVYGAGDCLRIRPAPSTAGDPLSCQLDGTRVHIFGGPQQAEGITWWQLRDLGWASGEYLIPAP